MKKNRKIFILFVTIFAMTISLFGVKSLINASTPKVLTNVISGIRIWSPASNNYFADNGGVYPFVQNREYRFEFSYDLSRYDQGANGGLNDGDYFSVNIPAPLTVLDSTSNLVDSDTQVEIATLEVTSNGLHQGGNVKVTLKNLQQYMDVKQSTTVFGIKGKVYAQFRLNQLNAQVSELIFSDNLVNVPIRVKYTVSPRPTDDFTDVIGKENLAKVGNVRENAPWQSDILGLSGQHQQHWKIRVNARKETYSKLSLVDTISENGAPAQFIPESVRIYSGTFQTDTFEFGTTSVEQIKGVDYNITYNETYTEFKINFINPGNKSYIVDYLTTGTFDGGRIGNRAQLLGENDEPIKIKIDSPLDYNVEYRNSRVTQGGTITIDTAYSVLIYKVDGSTLEKLAGAVFEIIKPDGSTILLQPTDKFGKTITPRFTENEINAGEFRIREVTPPIGYKRITGEISLRIPQQGIIKTIKNEKVTTSLKVTKQWIGPKQGSVEVKVYNENDLNTALATQTITEATNWEATFNNLPKFNANGTEAKYVVKETPFADYTAEITGNQITGFTITNTNKEVINIPVKKQWIGPKQGSVEVKVYNENDLNTALATQTITEATNWEATFNNLPKFNANGTEAKYVVKETPFADYTAEITGNQITGFTITNTNKETTLVEIEKRWIGKKLDEIKVEVLQNGNVIKTVTLNQANQFKTSIIDLPKYDELGKEYVYDVKEMKVSGYSVKVERNLNKFIMTNTEKPTKPSIDTSDYGNTYMFITLVTLLGMILLRKTNQKA